MTLYIIAGIIFYLSCAAWTNGYLSQLFKDREDNVGNSYLPADYSIIGLFGGVFWPLSMIIIALAPISNFGKEVRRIETLKNRKRIAVYNETKKELDEVEQELEQALSVGKYSNLTSSLSKAARVARTPRPPEELVGALQDRIHSTEHLPARPAITKKSH